MKRRILYIYVLSFIALYGFSQSLTLSSVNGPLAPNATIVQAGTPDSATLITYLHVKNTGSSSIDVLCKKVELNMIDSTEIYMCWAGGCSAASTYVSPQAQAISPGQIITEFSGHYSSLTSSYYFKSGESIVRWVFFDQNNTNDSVSVTVKYTTYPLGIAESDVNRGTLSNAYPNPAAGNVFCNYSVPPGSQGTILIRDILGTTVQTELLPAASGKATIAAADLPDGIYFCSLMIDGKLSQTKKLVVKH